MQCRAWLLKHVVLLKRCPVQCQAWLLKHVVVPKVSSAVPGMAAQAGCPSVMLLRRGPYSSEVALS